MTVAGSRGAVANNEAVDIVSDVEPDDMGSTVEFLAHFGKFIDVFPRAD